MNTIYFVNNNLVSLISVINKIYIRILLFII